MGNAWDGKFITENDLPRDWLATQDNTLWQGAGGKNNPCPSSYRLPTELEWWAEATSWSSFDHIGAFNSPLKVPLGGWRRNDGVPFQEGTTGYYWTSTLSATLTATRSFVLRPNVVADASWRTRGFSVRCIKD